MGSCEQDENVSPAIEMSHMSDIEGNVYLTVKIGNKWWMAENLKVKKYRDGTPVLFVQNVTDEWADASAACCKYSSQAPGLLYNFDAVVNNIPLAPEGWHIATDSEWKELEQHLGMTPSEADGTGWRGEDQGEKMRLEGLSGWIFYEGVWSTNSSGFSAEAGSCILFDGRSGVPGLQYHGFWWTSSEHSSTDAWYRHLDYKKRNIFRSHGMKNYGFSIRCVKD